jgi:hypothetical protein
MNKDPRNLGLIETTDGVPFFDDQKRGAWPFVIRVGNLPAALSTHMTNCHLHLLTANEYWEMDKKAGVLRRLIRAPKSLKPHLGLVVDDLQNVYINGVRAVDASVPLGLPNRVFACRCILLFWTGDFPGVSECAGRHEKCCHWCRLKSKHSPEVNRQTWGGYRSFLPTGHVMRRANHGPGGWPFPHATNEPPPAPRTSASYKREGEDNERHWHRLRMAGKDARREGIFKKDAPEKKTGIKEASPLCQLHLWNMVWDMLGDVMHIVPGLFGRHIMECLRGNRPVARVRSKQSYTDAQNAQLQADHLAALRELKSWAATPVTSTRIRNYYIVLRKHLFLLRNVT